MLRRTRVALVIATLAWGLATAPELIQAEDAGVGDPTRPFVTGIALGMYFEEPGRSYEGYLWEIARTGASTVSLVPSWSQPTVTASDIRPIDGRAPSDADLVRAIRSAHAMGLDVMLMPILDIEHREQGEWRGRLVPNDVAAWFEAYNTFILHYVEIAVAEDVDWLSIGSELGSMEGYEVHWRGLIEAIRPRFGGRLTYSANWDHYARTPFWDALDVVGVSGYFELTDSPEPPPTVDELVRAWEPVIADLAELSAYLQRPVMITEIGYVSQSGAGWRPWDYTLAREIDLLAQRDLYEAMLISFDDAEFLAGLFVWNWFGDGGSNDRGYSPRHKPAEQVIRRWYAEKRSRI